MWKQISDAPVSERLRTEVGPERIAFGGGLQPYLFRSASGAMMLGNASCGAAVSSVSRDQGRTWERWLPPNPPPDMLGHPTNPFNPNIREVPGIPCAAMGQRADGVILALDPVAHGPDQFGNFHCKLFISSDDLKSFSVKTVPVHHPRGRSGVDDGGQPCGGLSFCRSLLTLPDGTLLASGYGWCEGDTTPCPYIPAATKSRAMLFRSDDGGDTWRHLSDIAVGADVGEEGFSENVVARISGGSRAGRLVALMRTGSNNCAIYQAHSDDDGRTWSVPRALPFGGVFPDLIEMADGTLACSVGWRIWGGGPMQNYYVVFSLDGGDTWTNLTLLPLMDYTATPYPCGTWYSGLREAAPGQLLVVYDFGAFKPTWPVKYIASRVVRVTRD